MNDGDAGELRLDGVPASIAGEVTETVDAEAVESRFQVRHFINLHKALVPVAVLALMWHYDHWGPLPWVYLALHGTYAWLWLVKERTFPDRRFAEPIPLWMGVAFVFVPLASYWVAPYLIASRHLAAPGWLIGLAVAMTVAGVFLHFVSDAYKHAVLRLRPGLITDGLFARTRNPNYLGEMLIYSGFATLAQHPLPWLVLAAWWAFFVRNMLAKDASISRYPEFAAWKSRSGLLIPKLW